MKEKSPIIFLLVLGLLAIIAIVMAVVFTNKPQDNQTVDLLRMYPGCNIAETCGDLVGINCRAEVDGPYYYVKKQSGEVVSTCGGACMMGNCENCPPKEWTCI